jgi:hypothetical protein
MFHCFEKALAFEFYYQKKLDVENVENFDDNIPSQTTYVETTLCYNNELIYSRRLCKLFCQ